MNNIEKAKAKLSANYVRSLLRYDPESGIVVWISGRREGKIAGQKPSKAGYLRVGINGSAYQLHRVIWLLMTGSWPALDIDHEDTDKINNRWRNLREATGTQNQANKNKPKNNTSGHKGVFWFKQYNKWKASIGVNGDGVFLGYFDSRENAVKAYEIAARRYFDNFARVD